ncbi:MAG: DUF4105 domain-containing protein [Nitrosomonadales bacterium]|nr:DUF4105 domain-containing protein [Nitrosomonadales bacterium]
MRQKLAFTLLILGFLLATIWAAFALWYQLPAGTIIKSVMIAVWLAFSGLTAWAAWRYRSMRGGIVYMLGLALLITWWQTLTPSNVRDWADDVAETTTVKMQGSIATISHVRNFDWRSKTDYTAQWESRQYDLDQLRTVDMLLSYWTGPAIAHTLVSFGFDDGRFLVFSVEIRKERHEEFSGIGGFFKMYETSIIAAEERDIVRLRTNIRREDVYLYRIDLAQDDMRKLFLAYAEEANLLAEEPRFYHSMVANCTTIVYHMVRQIIPGLPMDYRLLLSGYLPEYLYSIGGLDTTQPLETLHKMGRIAERALAADSDPDFSQAIRRGIPTLPEQASSNSAHE